MANAVQVITITGGTDPFALSFGGYTTAQMVYNASAATVSTALQSLASIGSDNVVVTGSNGGPYTVEFVGALANTNVGMISSDNGGTGMYYRANGVTIGPLGKPVATD